MFVILASLATVFNFIIVKIKLENKRFADAIVDISVALILGSMFMGSMLGMSIAMMASAMMSIYLWFYPPKVPTLKQILKRKKRNKK